MVWYVQAGGSPLSGTSGAAASAHNGDSVRGEATKLRAASPVGTWPDAVTRPDELYLQEYVVPRPHGLMRKHTSIGASPSSAEHLRAAESDHALTWTIAPGLAPLLDMMNLFHTALAHCNACCGPTHPGDSSSSRSNHGELAPPAAASKGVFLKASIQLLHTFRERASARLEERHAQLIGSTGPSQGDDVDGEVPREPSQRAVDSDAVRKRFKAISCASQP